LKVAEIVAAPPPLTLPARALAIRAMIGTAILGNASRDYDA
jgi:hypothetical protein